MLQKRLQVQDSIVCYGHSTEPIDQGHVYIYQGKESQRYLCTSCGRVVSKTKLRADSDPNNEVVVEE